MAKHTATKITLDTILKKNLEYTYEYRKSDIMLMLDDSSFEREEKRLTILACIQTFSNYFQRTMLLRAALADSKDFQNLAYTHLDEEYGHNRELLKDRKEAAAQWDPILDATSSWFSWKMFTLNDVEKTLLIHLVLEASANIFFKKANEIMSRYNTTTYFNIHAECDEAHENLGTHLLNNLRSEEYQNLLLVQQQGWDVLNAVCDRIAVLCKR